MEDYSLYDEQPSGPAAILESVKKFGIGKLLVMVILLAGVLWFFVLSPKPGTVRVSVSEIDSGNALDGVEVDLTPAGQKMLSLITPPSGTVVFNNVPAQVDISIDIIPPSTHKVSGELPSSFKLDSQQTKNIPIILAQVSDIKITASSPKLTLGTDCNTGVDINVQNPADSPASVHLIGTGDLKDVIQSTSTQVAPKSSQTITVNVTTPGKTGTLSGTIRNEFTDASDSLTVEVTEPEELNVNPQQFSEQISAGNSGAPYSTQFTVSNNGRNNEAHLLPVSITGDFQNYQTQAIYADNTPLKSGQSKILTLTFNPPSAPGTTHGVMIVSSACQSIQVPLQLTINPAQS